MIILAGDIHPNPGPPFRKEINFMHNNVNSLVAGSKIDELSAIVIRFKLDVVAISETWLGDSVNSADILLNGFQAPIRRDRNRHGGGVLIYVSE